MVEVDELCWWFLREMALMCGNYSEIEEIYYLIPHSNMDEGLRRVYNDKEVLEMADIVTKNREIVLYVVHAKQLAMVFDGVGVGSGTNKQVVGQMRKKQPAVVNNGVGVGSVINEQVDGQMRKKQHVVVFDGVGVGKDDGDKDEFLSDVEYGDSSDDELKEARQRLKKKKNVELYEIAKRLQTEAAEGKLGVGQRFTTREAFREVVAQYAVAQGKNLSFGGSNKKQLQRLEAKCLPGCHFNVYGSWDKRRACFVVKSLEEKHTCNRNMVKNIQLKATWLAKQFLEIFKSRPHWPAKEIKETARIGFKALLNAVATILQNSEHRHCARHIFAHWHKSFRAEDNTAAELAFRGYNPSLLCRAFLDTNTKVDVIVNNLAETFNGYIINSRTKHLIYMLEEIRSNLMQRLVMKRMEMEKHNKMLCPKQPNNLKTMPPHPQVIYMQQLNLQGLEEEEDSSEVGLVLGEAGVEEVLVEGEKVVEAGEDKVQCLTLANKEEQDK
ncbi:Leucine-zipper-like transcriptional regulator 1 [Bienertia sinuspersici]